MVSSSALVSFSAVLRDVAIVARHEIPLPESFSTVFAFPVRKVCCFVAHSFCESGASGTLLVWNWLRSSDELFEVDIDSANTLRRYRTEMGVRHDCPSLRHKTYLCPVQELPDTKAR
jgi:hypothetical protein